MALLKQNTAYSRSFYMVENTNHINPAFGVSPAVLISKAGFPFAAVAGGISEIGYGWYRVVLTTADTSNLGDLSFAITATFCDPVQFVDQVIAVDLMDAVAFGLSRIDAAISSRSTYSGGAVASVTGSVGSVTGAVGSVTSPVTVGTNSDKSGYSLAIPPPTVSQIRQEMDTNSSKLDVAVSTRSTYNGGPVSAVTGAVGSVTGNVEGNVLGSVNSVVSPISVGSVASVTGSVGSVTSPVDITQGAADKVWNSVNRTLSSFGTLIADMWSAVSRTLTYYPPTAPLSVGDKDAIIHGVLATDLATVPAPASRSLLNAVRFLRNKWSIGGGVLTVMSENDVTPAWTAAVTTTPTAEPITTVDPT